MFSAMMVCAFALAPRFDAEGVPLPAEVLHRIGSARWRYQAGLGQPVVSADGRFVYTHAGADEIVVWEGDSGRTVERIPLPFIEKPSELRRFPNPLKLLGSFATSDKIDHRHTALTATGHLRVIDSLLSDGTVRTVDPATGRVLETIWFHVLLGQRVELSADGRWLAAHVVDVTRNASIDMESHSLPVRDLKRNAAAYSVPIKGEVRAFRFSPDGKRLAVADDASFRLLDAATGKLVDTLHRSRFETVADVQFGPDSRTVAGLIRSPSEIEYVAIWDTITGKELLSKKLPRSQLTEKGQTYQLVYRPDVKRLAIIEDRVGVRILNTDGGQPVADFREPCYVRGCFSPTGDRFYMAAKYHDGYGMLYRLDLSVSPPKVVRPSKGQTVLAYPTNDELLILNNYELTRCNPATGETRSRVFPLLEDHGQLVWPTLSPDGTRAALKIEDRNRYVQTVLVVDTKTEQSYTLEHKGVLNCIDFHFTSDGATLIGSDYSHIVVECNLRTGKSTNPDLTKNKEENDGICIRVQADSGPLAVITINTYAVDVLRRKPVVVKVGPVSLYDLRSPDIPLWRFTPDGGDCYNCLLIRDGRRVVMEVKYDSKTALELWDGPTGRRCWRRVSPPATTGLLAQSPDGRTIVGTTASEEIVLLETATGQIRHTFYGHRSWIERACFSPDGRILAATSAEAPVYLWDVAGELVKPSTPPDLAAAWADLASPDAKVAFQAIRRLAWFPEQSLPLLREKLPPAAPYAMRLAKAIADLDAPAFADREAAVKDLKALGDLAVPQLEATLKKTDSTEVRERIEKLLAANATPPGADGLRAVRAVEAVEWIGTPAAHALLKAWAGGAAGARLTREAAEALGRARR